MRIDGATAENVKQLEFSVPTVLDHRFDQFQSYAMSLKAIVISAPRQFERFNFRGKATITDVATGNNVEQLEFSVPIVFGPQNLIWTSESDCHLRMMTVRTS